MGGALHEYIGHMRYIWFNHKSGPRAWLADATVHAVPATTAETSGESDGCRPSGTLSLVGEA